MIENEIDFLRQQLHILIDKEADFKEIYNLSVKLDELILKFYREKLFLKN